MVMNFILRTYFGMVYRMNSWTALWEDPEQEDQPEEEIKVLLEEVKGRLSSLTEVVQQQNEMMKKDFPDTELDVAASEARRDVS